MIEKTRYIDDLIYDVGMHNGDDTAYYLWKGYRVVAIEANPIMVERSEQRFADAISARRLTILNIGIGPRSEIRPFWINTEVSEWSAFDHRIASRAYSHVERAEVQCRPFTDILGEFGTPVYLKSDIEGADIHVLQALNEHNRPKYVSVEANELIYLILLNQAGFNRFKCINQRDHNVEDLPANNRAIRARARYAARGLVRRSRILTRLSRRLYGDPARARGEAPSGPFEGRWVFSPGSSGPFGEETRGPWRSLEHVAYEWLPYRLGLHSEGTIDHQGWYDFHASAG